MSEAPPEQVRLTVPARGEFGKLTRMTAARLGRTCGLVYREIEDLRLAIDEALIALLDENAEPDPGSDQDLEVRFTLPRRSIEVTFDARLPVTADRATRFQRLVAGLVDEAELDADAGTIRLVKSHNA